MIDDHSARYVAAWEDLIARNQRERKPQLRLQVWRSKIGMRSLYHEKVYKGICVSTNAMYSYIFSCSRPISHFAIFIYVYATYKCINNFENLLEFQLQSKSKKDILLS